MRAREDAQNRRSGAYCLRRFELLLRFEGLISFGARRSPRSSADRAVGGGGRRRDVGLEVLEPSFGDVGDGSRGGFAESLNGLRDEGRAHLLVGAAGFEPATSAV